MICQICLSCVMTENFQCICACVRSCSVGRLVCMSRTFGIPFCLSLGRMCATSLQGVSICCRILLFFLLWVVSRTIVEVVHKTGRGHAIISQPIVCFLVLPLVGVAYASDVSKNWRSLVKNCRTSLFLHDSACLLLFCAFHGMGI